MPTDLEKIRQQREAMDEVNLQRAEAAAIDRVREWDKAMQRAFKGIVSRPLRHRMMEEAARDAGE